MAFNFKFSSRTNWELTANALADLTEQLRSSRVELLDLTESNPTRCGFQYPLEFIPALNQPVNLDYTPDSKGMLPARKAVAEYYAALGIARPADDVILTSSTSEGYTFLFRLLLNPGEKVLIAHPSYPLFQYLLELSDATYDFYALYYENGRWQIDFESLKQAVDETTRAIIVVNPNNPTGSYISREELQTLNEICQRFGLALISDEVFYDYRLDPSDDCGVSLAGNSQVATFVLNGLSKNLGLPQMKLSWILINGPQSIKQEALNRLEMIADTFLSVNTPVQNALPLWMPYRTNIQEQILRRVRDNHRRVKEFAQACRADFFVSRAGWYAVVHSSVFRPEDGVILELLRSKHVLVHPGYFFDFPQEGFLVFSLLPPAEIMGLGLKSVLEWVKEKK